MGSLKSGAHSRSPEIRVSYYICFNAIKTWHACCLSLFVPWNLLSRLATSSTASLTAWTGFVTIWWISENDNILVMRPRMSDYWSSKKIHFSGLCDPPGTVLYSTKLNITTPTTTQDRRAARAISSSADIFSFPRSPRLWDPRELTCGAAAPLDPVPAEEEKLC